MLWKNITVVVILIFLNVVTSLSVSNANDESIGQRRMRNKRIKIAKPKIEQLDREENRSDKPEVDIPVTTELVTKFDEDFTKTGTNDEKNTKINLINIAENLMVINENYHENDSLSTTQRFVEDKQDEFIDVKGRSGFVQEERPEFGNQIIPEDYTNQNFNPYDFQSIPYNEPRQTLKQPNEFLYPQYDQHQRYLYKDRLKPYNLNYHPAYFNQMGHEINYPKSPENVWEQFNYPNNVPSHLSLENCLTCHRNSDSMDKKAKEIPYRTANGRSLEYDPSEGNSYPYGGKEAIANKHDNFEELRSRTVQPLEYSNKQETEGVSKIIIQPSSPVVMKRRIGLTGTGYHIISGSIL